MEQQITLVEHECSLAKWDIDPANLRGARVPRDQPAGVESRLAWAGDLLCGDVWLWCRGCHRYFQVKHLRASEESYGHAELCPFNDCRGAGFDMDIFHWTDPYTGPGAPVDESELRVGLQYPPTHCDVCGARLGTWRGDRARGWWRGSFGPK